MISPKLTNCKECANIPDLLRRIDCKIAELGNNLYNNVVFMLNRPIATSEISQLLVYKRVLRNRFCDTHYAKGCPDVSTEDIASKVIRLTAGCVPHCGEPTVCEITTCPITPVPNPTTTSTSTSSTSTTSTTSTSSTSTTTTTLNCNFSGVIVCNPSTTTTTTLAPTTTTSTTYFPDPFGVPCLWSTNGGDSGLLAVYDFDTNTATNVLVPNDFTETYGIERPICATEDKLWLASVVDKGSNPDNDADDVVYIREWDIDATGAVPVLIYVREITLYSGGFSASNLGGSSVWAMTAIDNNTLIVGTGNENGAPSGTGGNGSLYAYEFDISTAGDIAISNSDVSTGHLASAGTGTTKLSNLTYANSGQLIVGYRYDLTPDGSGSTNEVGNHIKVFNTTPSNPQFTVNDIAIEEFKLQDKGYPEFTSSYTGVKDAPFWGVNGLAQVLQPENLQVYTLEQGPNYDLTLTTSVNSSNDWLSSATHCSNIKFELSDNLDCGITYFPAMFDAEDNYLGPQTFEYNGMTVEASLTGNITAFDNVGPAPFRFLGCSGLAIPATTYNVTKTISGNNFQLQLTFPQPVNNITIRAAVLNSNADLTSGDVYQVNTNVGAPELSIVQGCKVQVIGNKFGGGIGDDGQPSSDLTDGNDSGGEFLVTAPSDFTIMNIFGNAPTGGPLLLGCPPVNCDNMIFTRQGATSCSLPESAGRCVTPPDVPVNQTSYSKIFVWNKVSGVCTEIGPPPGTGFGSGDISIGNNIVVMSANFNTGSSPSIDQCFIKYDCDVTNGVPSNLQWDGKKYVLPPYWDEYNGNSFIPNIEVINDNQIGVIVRGYQGPPCYYDPKFLICTFPETGEEMIVEDKNIQFPCGSNQGGDHVVTYKPDGVTPNKLIVLQGVEVFLVGQAVSWKIAVCQYDINSGALEVITKAEDWIDPSGIGAALAIVDGELYAGSSVWAKVDFNYPYSWTILDDDEAPCPAGGAGTVPACRISDGFEPNPVSTTSTTTDPNTTTTTTTIIPGVRTIFTKFSGPIEN